MAVHSRTLITLQACITQWYEYLLVPKFLVLLLLCTFHLEFVLCMTVLPFLKAPRMAYRLRALNWDGMLGSFLIMVGAVD